MAATNLKNILAAVMILYISSVYSTEQVSEAFKKDMERVAKEMRENVDLLEKDENGKVKFSEADSLSGFEAVDKNNDKYIEYDEIFEFTKETITNITEHAKVIAEKVIATDSDGDKKLDFKEFHKLTLKNKQAYEKALEEKCSVKKDMSKQIKKLEELKEKPLFKEIIKEQEEEKRKKEEQEKRANSEKKEEEKVESEEEKEEMEEEKEVKSEEEEIDTEFSGKKSDQTESSEKTSIDDSKNMEGESEDGTTVDKETVENINKEETQTHDNKEHSEEEKVSSETTQKPKTEL